VRCQRDRCQTDELMNADKADTESHWFVLILELGQNIHVRWSAAQACTAALITRSLYYWFQICPNQRIVRLPVRPSNLSAAWPWRKYTASPALFHGSKLRRGSPISMLLLCNLRPPPESGKTSSYSDAVLYDNWPMEEICHNCLFLRIPLARRHQESLSVSPDCLN
jgi:hypothetical protein